MAFWFIYNQIAVFACMLVLLRCFFCLQRAATSSVLGQTPNCKNVHSVVRAPLTSLVLNPPTVPQLVLVLFLVIPLACVD